MGTTANRIVNERRTVQAGDIQAAGTHRLEPIRSREDPKGDLKRKKKHWLQDTVTKTKELHDKAQARYMKNYDASLRKQSAFILEKDYMYLRVERKNHKDHLHKLALVAEGPSEVIKIDDKMVFIEKADHSVENVSRSQIVFVPKRKPKKKVERHFNQ